MKLSINQLKYLKLLHERKHRQKYHNFIVEGVKLANEVLESNTHMVEMVVALPDWLAENGHLLRNVETVVAVDEKELKKISLLTTPNQVFLVVKQANSLVDWTSVGSGLSLYLDDIRDPGNLGTILRIADWFGIKWVFGSLGSVELFNPKVIQASMGAFLRVSYLELDLEEICEKLPGMPVYGTVLDGNSIFKEKLESPAMIVIGNESRGLSPAVQTVLTHRIAIPRSPEGGAESLNAAVATGIICALFRSMDQIPNKL